MDINKHKSRTARNIVRAISNSTGMSLRQSAVLFDAWHFGTVTLDKVAKRWRCPINEVRVSAVTLYLYGMIECLRGNTKVSPTELGHQIVMEQIPFTQKSNTQPTTHPKLTH